MQSGKLADNDFSLRCNGERLLPGASVVRFGSIPGGWLSAPSKGAGWIQFDQSILKKMAYSSQLKPLGGNKLRTRFFQDSEPNCWTQATPRHPIQRV
jgi:hypothetical protein